MPLFGKIIVIKRNGTDGIHFPLTASSCLFGRKTECDIRIQLPQVSKEHCKIEVNENKEAVLTNLSAVNPTQLNGGCFQQPVPLKHGDVLTIIDRSFRFEYPPQSTPRKRRSRSPKNETLQVLHVQQVAEVELLHKQTSGSQSLHDSDNTKYEEQNVGENKQNMEENISKTSHVKLTTKSFYKTNRSNKRENEMSPFSKLYETLKHEIKVKKTLQEGNVSQQAGKDSKGALLESSPRISSSDYARGLGSLTKETKKETPEEYKVKQEVVGSEFNLIAATGSATKRCFTRSPRTSVSNEMSRNICRKNLLQDYKEQNTLDKSGGTEVATKPNKDNEGNAACSLKQCSIECLGYADRIYSSARKTEQLVQTNAVTNAVSKDSVSEIDKCVLSTPQSKRRSSRFSSISSTKEISGMGSVNADAPTNLHNVLLECKGFSEISTEPQEEDVLCRNESLEKLPLAENTCSKQRRISKQHTPGKSVKEEVLKENCDQANVVNSEERHSETPALLPDSKSPRRNIRQSKVLSNDSVCSEMQHSEELTPEHASPANQKSSPGRKRGRPRTSGVLSNEELETEVVQHQDKIIDEKGSGTKEELVTKDDQQKLDLEGTGVKRLRSLSSKRRSGSSAMLKEDEVLSEMNISSPLAKEEESGNARGISQKRKSDDLLHQPFGKRKRVSFGGHLSPELFDKSLPPNSPLKRGAIPARLSLPFGNSPRAVLKRAQGSKHLAVQKEEVSPKHLLPQGSPAASCPVSGKSTPKLNLSSPEPYTTGRFSVSHIPTPSPVAEEQDAVAKDVNTQEKHNARVETPNSSHTNQDDKIIPAANKLTRSVQLALKNTPTRRKSGAVAVFNAKRRSGASSANLLVAKSWAEVVKLGVARPQAKAIKKSVLKGRSAKKITQMPKTPERKVKGHFSTGHAESPATIVVGRAYATTVRMAGQVPKVVKNPAMRQNMDMDESFTGMAEMFQTPENKSRKRPSLSPVQKMDFTPTCSTVDVSELQTPEESGEMIVSPLNSSDASEQKPDICYFLRDEDSLKSVVDEVSTNPPENQEAMQEENISRDSLHLEKCTNPEKCTSQVKLGLKGRTPKEKLEPVEVLSGIKQLVRTPEQKLEPGVVSSGVKRNMRTPKQKSDPAEVLSGVKQLMKTPKQKLEPAEVLSGVKQLMGTPKQKPEPAEVLSGIKQLMRTPKQKPEPAEVLSGVKQLMRTPKQKPEPAEVLSGVKQLLRTPKQKPEPAEVLSGVKQLLRTPKQKPEPAEVLSGVKQLMRTPKQKLEPAEVLSGVKQLMRTPKQKLEPAEVLSGVKQLMRTPKQKPEPAEVLSGVKQLMRTPKQKPEPAEVLSGVKQLMRTPKEKLEPVEVLSGVKQLLRTPKEKLEPAEVLSGVKQLLRTPKQKSEATAGETGFNRLLKAPVEAETDMSGTTINKKTPKPKYQPVEDMIGVSRIFKTPKEKAEPVEDMFGISRLVRTPKEKYEAVEDFVGLKKLMAEPRQKCSDLEVEFVGVKEMFDVPEEIKVSSVKMGLEQEDTVPPCTNSSQEFVDKGNISESEKAQQTVSSSKDQCAKKSGRGRPRKTVHPVSENPPEKNLEEDANVKELKALEKKSIQAEMEVVSASASVAKGLRGRKRTNPFVQEAAVSGHTGHENAEAVELCGVAQRPRRGKRNEPKELKHQSESLECHDKDSSLLQKESAYIRQTLRKYEVTNILITEDGQGIKTESMSSHVQNANCQLLPTEFGTTENKSNEDSIEDSETLLLPPRNTSRGKEKVETTESVISSKRGRRTKNDQANRSPSKEPRGTARKLRKEPSTKITQGDEQVLDQNISEAASVEKPEAKNMKNEGNVSLGKAAEIVQENATEASQRVKSESPSGETKKAPATVLHLERSRTRRIKKDSLEIKTEESVRDAAVPKFKSEAGPEETSVKDYLDSPYVKDVNKAAATAVPATDSGSADHNWQTQAKNEQELLKTQQMEMVQESQRQINKTTLRRGRGRKVNFELEEANSKALGGKSLPGDEKGITDKDGQHDTSENNSSQLRRSRRRQVDSVLPTACSTLAEKKTVIEDHSKDETFVKDQDPALETALSSTEENPLRWDRRREVAVASQTTSSLSVGKKRRLPEGDDKKMPVKEDQNTALGNKTCQAKSNAAARDKRKKIDPGVEAKSSSSLQRKHGLSETDDKEQNSNQEQNRALETVSLAREKPLGRGRRKETAFMSHTTNCTSLRGRRGVPTDNGKEETPKENQKVTLEIVASPAKETQLKKVRRKEVTLTLEATNSVQRKQGTSKENGRKNIYREAEKVFLEDSASQEKMDLSKANSRPKANVTSLVVPSTSPQGKNSLQNSGKNETREEQQSLSVEIVPLANLSRASRKKTVSFKSEEAGSTFLREKRGLPEDIDQKDTVTEDKNSSLDNNSSQEKTRPLRNKRKKIEFESEKPTSTALHDSGNLPENGSTSEIPEKCLKSTNPPKSNPPRKGREVNLIVQTTSTSRRRKCQLPEDDLASKKLKSENDENSSLQKSKRNKTKEELDKCNRTTQQTVGGTDRKTRSSSRTSTRTRH
ncbi:proliferation marker protein Ki-67 [Eudromia elegans]